MDGILKSNLPFISFYQNGILPKPSYLFCTGFWPMPISSIIPKIEISDSERARKMKAQANLLQRRKKISRADKMSWAQNITKRRQKFWADYANFKAGYAKPLEQFDSNEIVGESCDICTKPKK